MALDLIDRLHAALFTRGIGSVAAVFYGPGQDPDVDGVPCRIILSTRDEARGQDEFSQAGLLTTRTIIEVRVRELRDAGAANPAETGGFKINDATHELHDVIFEIDEEPMLLDNHRRIWTCYVSQPDGAA
ncbi:head-tail joining protein [Hyphobacterium sp.]|uniref:head-tail joining protein n=1 Tax=Hyphobacterium sp. TaxID=2004662 RepID=UPI003BAD69B1